MKAGKKEPTRTVNKRAAFLPWAYGWRLRLIQFVLITGCAIWAYFSTPRGVFLSDRILFAFFTGATVFLAFKTLSRNH
jgi:hypothetical protein